MGILYSYDFHQQCTFTSITQVIWKFKVNRYTVLPSRKRDMWDFIGVWVGEMLSIQQKIIVLKAANYTKYKLISLERSSSLSRCNWRLLLATREIQSSWLYYQFVCSSYRPAIRCGDLSSPKPGHGQPTNIARYALLMEPGNDLLLKNMWTGSQYPWT